ncbi:MAG: PAS domain S-box protein, partial [Betaproteobacteria bacterium]
EARFRNTFDFASIGMAIVSLEGRWVQINAALSELLGYNVDELKRLTFQNVTHPDDLQADLAYIERVLRGEISTYQMEKRYFHRDGHVVWALLSVSLVRDIDGAPVHFVSQIQDITARKYAEQALTESEERFRATFDHASVGIMHSSLDRRILVLNRKFCEMVGYSADELQQGSVRRIHHPDDSDADQPLEKQLLAGEIENFSFEKRYVRKNASVFWANRTVSLVRDQSGKPQYFIRVIEDISARKDAEEKLLHLAHFDPLTDLPNRAMFHDRLSQALVQARRRNELVGIMFLDLDHFKLVNDTLGHAMGDLLLQLVAGRLSAAVRPGDTVGRLSGDEFGIILGDLRSVVDASLVAKKILKVLAPPFRLDRHERNVTMSIGISLYPEHGDDNDLLIRAADTAMYAAKEKGRSTFEFFSETTAAGAAEQSRAGDGTQ